jgi:hypothetical protein
MSILEPHRENVQEWNYDSALYGVAAGKTSASYFESKHLSDGTLIVGDEEVRILPFLELRRATLTLGCSV